MKTCDNCSSDVSNDQVYCNKCGHKVNPSLLDNHATFYTEIGKGLKIPVNPITFDYCYQIGATAMDECNYYEALEYFNHAIAFYDVDRIKLSQIYTDIGSIYRLTKNDFDKSIEYYELAISSNSKNHAAYQNLISSKNEIDDYDGAIAVFKRMIEVIQIRELNPRVLHLVGMVCENQRRYEAAKKFYEDALQRGYKEAQTDLDEVVRKINKLKM